MFAGAGSNGQHAEIIEKLLFSRPRTGDEIVENLIWFMSVLAPRTIIPVNYPETGRRR